MKWLWWSQRCSKSETERSWDRVVSPNRGVSKCGIRSKDVPSIHGAEMIMSSPSFD